MGQYNGYNSLKWKQNEKERRKMIDFKYKGYEVKIGGIANTTKVTADNGMDSCVWLFSVNSPKQAKWHRFVKKIQQAITERINYMRKEEV